MTRTKRTESSKAGYISGSKSPVILFDGVCNLCNGAVQFIIKRDKQQRFRFASLQSEFARTLPHDFPRKDTPLETIILLEEDQVFQRSDAVLRIARHVGGGWSTLYWFRFIPRLLRDGVYNFIARNRYHLFGKRDQCMIPTPELKERFLM